MFREALIRYDKCTKNYQLALPLLDEQLQNASFAEKPGMYQRLGEVYLELGKYEDALKYLDLSQTTWQADFPPGFILFEMAEAEYFLGNYELAKEYILSGERMTWIRWGMPYYFLGMIIWQEGDPDNALIYLEWAEQTLDDGKLLDATRQKILEIKSSSAP
jgi:tetratricopeptide (TPR) repeat protein